MPLPLHQVHPEEAASTLCDELGFLCFKCDAYFHRSWKTAHHTRRPLLDLLATEGPSYEQLYHCQEVALGLADDPV